MARDRVDVDIGGRTVSMSSLDRILFPATGFRKAEMLDYYVAVADALLPHIAGRPITLHRFPDGVGGPHFFQTRTPPHPEWVRVQRMYTFRHGKDVDTPVIDDLPGLVWAVNLSTIELHPYLATVDHMECPDVLVFDLDPGPPATVVDACRVALEVRELLDALGLAAYPKTSGAKGVHVYVPLEPVHVYEETKAFARGIAGILSRRSPGRILDRMTKDARAGRVFVDWSQNDPGKSTVAPYSLRGLEVPSVSTPVTWDEVARAASGNDPGVLWFGVDDVLERLHSMGELFEPVLVNRQRLPRALPA